MIVIDKTVWSRATPKEAFNYLADFTTTTEWDAGTLNTTRIFGDGGLGTVYRNISVFAGRQVTLDYVVVDLVPGQQIRLRGENPSVICYDTITVVPSKNGAMVIYRAEFQFRRSMALLTPMLHLAVTQLGKAGAAGMRTALAQRSKTATAAFPGDSTG